MRRLLAGLSLAALLTAPALARENHALLVGVSEYPGLGERYWLKGPANDVQLIAAYLTRAAPVPFDPANVILLADGVEGADLPTLAAIRAAFAALIERVEPGDFVYLHFSGHGTQAPERVAGSELNGMDQLFLPMDIGPWNDTFGAVENALVDDEIGLWIAALTAKGAHVWAVFDACHSASATRGLEAEEVRTRQLPPEALGIPVVEDAATRALGAPAAADPRARPDAPIAPVERSSGAGSLVAFFAAQTSEVTPEQNMPPGKLGRKPHGVFTYTLFEVLAEYPGITYAQLAQEVLRRYSVKNLARTTPMFEGDLDGVVFGGEGGGRVAQWPAERAGDEITIPAGALHGLAEGAVLALLPAAAASMDAVLGYVEVVGLETFTARLRPVAHAGLDAPAARDLPRGVYVRQIEAALDFTLTVALPEGEGPEAALMRAAAALLVEDGLMGPRVRFVEPGEAADVRLAVIPDSSRPDAIWMLPGTGLVDAAGLASVPSVGTAGRDAVAVAEIMAENLMRMARALNLLKLGASVSGGGGGLEAGVEVELLLGAGGSGALAALDASAVPRLVPGDIVYARIRNTLDIAVDVNVLYIGSDHSITHMWAGQLLPGDELRRQGLFRVTDDAFGRDRVVVILTPARRQGTVENLAFLAQEAVELTRSTGGEGERGFAGALEEAGFGATTRGAVPLGDDPRGPGPAILQFDLDTVPAAG
jgi:hypothetical protein